MFVPAVVHEYRAKINKVFFEGRIIPRHTDTEHFYEDTTDGAIYPSVTARTGILEKAHLKQWAANQAVDSMLTFLGTRSDYGPDELAVAAKEAREAHKAKLNQASQWGTEAHDIVDQYVTAWIAGNKPDSIRALFKPDTKPEAISAALGAEKFFNSFNLYPVASEKQIVSKKGKFGGTLDTLFVLGLPLDGKLHEQCKHQWKE